MFFRRFRALGLFGRCLSFSGLLGTPFVALNLHAQSMSGQSWWAPQAWMRGGAAVAWSDELDALSANPALLFRIKGAGSAGGDWMKLPKDIDRWSVGVADGRKAVVGGFRFDWVDEGRPTRHTYHLGLAYPTSYGSVGTSVHVYNFDDVARGKGWHVSQSLGVYVPFGPNFGISVLGRHLLDRAPDHLLPPEFATGFVYRFENSLSFQFQADRRFGIPDQDFNYSAGLDLITKKFFAVRGGFHWNHEKERRLWSTGAALEAPNSSLAGFYTRSIYGKDKDGFGLKLSVKF